MLAYLRSAVVCLPLFALLACVAHGAPAAVTPPASKPPGITVTSAVSDSALETGQSFTAWLTVTNSGGVPVSNLEILEWTAPGAELSRIYWTGSGGAQSCSLGAAAPSGATPRANSETTVVTSSCPPLAAVLAPGQSLSLSAELSAVREAPRSAVHVAIGWTAGGGPSTQGVTVGEVQIRSPISAFFVRVYGFLKDFALPIVLAILAFLFGRWDKKREAKRQEKADALAAAERRARDQRALVAETWQKRLSVMYELNTKYYLPLCSAISSTLYFGRQRGSETDAARKNEYARREFFGLVFAYRRMNYIADEIGGLFLKDMTGERIVSRCWQSFLKLFTENFRDDYFRLLTRMTSPIGLDETGDTFFSRMDAKQSDGSFTEGAAVLQEGWQRFQVWVGDAHYPAAIQRLKVLRQVLAFEINRPFLYWYGAIEPLPQDDGARRILLEVLQEGDSTDEERAASAKRLEQYMETACRECRIDQQV